MAKKTKKTVKKASVSVAKKRPHHPWDHHDLLLIVSGAFIVIILVILFSGGSIGSFSMFTKTSTSASESEMMENSNEKIISMKDFAYAPAVITVKEGTIVTWTNNDSVAHSATADEGTFDTGLLEQGESGSVTLNEAGEYTYHCSVHPNMTGKIIVEK